jgi:hypothetical protein
VKEYCKQLIDTVAGDGGYVMDASAIIQSDAQLENIKAMTEFTREYGVYRSPSSPSAKTAIQPPSDTPGLPAWVTAPKVRPGVCFPWEEKLKELPPISGDPALVRSVWENIEQLSYIYIWHVLLSF